MTSIASQADLNYAVYQVGQAANTLREAGTDTQSKLLAAMATRLEAQQDQVLEANTLDLEASLEMAVPDLVLDWLKLTPERLQTALKILRRLSALGDPRGSTQQPIGRLTQVISGYSQVVPLGVIALVYEAFPELSAIMAGLCVRTGNGLILKGGNEASQTNQAILQALHDALNDVGLPDFCILSLTAEQGDAARLWLLQDEGVDLVIPYGRPSLVQQVTRQAAVPVLPTAMGNCYLYWSATGQLDTVTQMIIDSHRGDPDAVNAIEKVLIHESCTESAIVKLCHDLWENNFDVLGHGALVAALPELKSAKQLDWERPFLGKTVALRRVENMATATNFINRYGSRHVSCLATDSYRDHGRFTRLIESAVIYTNTSPRFTRNPSQASAIALGMTGQRGCCSGFIGLDALLTTQHVLQGGI
jgi:glutamate-5-semialdehyde dehydrogenase